jgi:hypothetical protein
LETLSPCTECLVRPSCSYFCDQWFDWVIHKKLFPTNIELQIETFISITGPEPPIGPLAYWLSIYNIENIRIVIKDNDEPEVVLTTR